MKSAIVGFALSAWLATLSSPAEAQPQKPWRIGLFHVGLDHVPGSLARLREDLQALGYKDGKNVHLDWRNLQDGEAALKTAEEFARGKADRMIAFENQAIRAAKAVTSEIPVVFLHATDPVADGFVKSLARPGGNLTGFVGLRDLSGKRLELFRELIPKLQRMLLLTASGDAAAERTLAEVRRVGAGLKLQLIEHNVIDQHDIAGVFGALKRGEIEGAFIASSDLQQKFTALILGLATERRIPVIVHTGGWAEKGGLFSYGHDPASVGRDAARYVDKIIKGAKPADLPIEQPTKVEFIINLKTAKQMGLTIPPNVLARADKVIR